MINKIIEMLEREERVALDFVDRHAFLNQDHENEYDREAVAAIAKSSLVVKSILGGGAALALEDDRYCIPEKDYKYFKIKEPEYTFNDLIDVTVKAWKDGCLKVLKLEKGIVNQVFTVIDGIAYGWHDGDDDYSHAIDTIKSLYTETFVIESESDIKKTKEGASVELANGNVFIVNKSKHESLAMKDGSKATGLTFKDSNNFWITYSLFELKGATVTQEVSK